MNSLERLREIMKELYQEEKKSEYVQTNFNKIAEKYDLFNDLNSFFLHRIWKNSIISEIRKNSKKENLQCLDLCCGTGDISLRLAEMKESSKVFSVDFSENMLSIARKRLEKNPKSTVQFGDATDLKEFSSASFDAVTIGFGLRNVNQLEKTLSEVFRILKPGGIFINLDVGKVKNPIIRVFADFYFFKIVPILGYLIWGGKNEMFDYLPVSSLKYPGQEELKTIMQKNSFRNVEYRDFVFGNVTMHTGVKPE